jgi:hypothetical protein
MGEDEIRRRLRLGHVILVGSDIDRGILGGYVLDGALRVPKSLTLYQSSADSALSLSKLVFRRQRAGEALIGEMGTAQANRFLRSHPRLRVIDVSNAEGAVSGSGHGYLRESPWVSSDVVLSLRYDLPRQERGLVRAPGSPVWTFPDDYLSARGRRWIEPASPGSSRSQALAGFLAMDTRVQADPAGPSLLRSLEQRRPAGCLEARAGSADCSGAGEGERVRERVSAAVSLGRGGGVSSLFRRDG